jgi:DNA repair protein RadC
MTNQTTINETADAVEQLSGIRDKKQEHFVLLTLDSANHLISNSLIFLGTLDQCLVHPREIFAKVLEDRAASFIVAHNHPSGDLEPSTDDVKTTDKLREAGRIMGVSLLEHIIVSKSGHGVV